jgi:hypothetical protein
MKKKKLIQEVSTRWSSTYEMICDLHCDSQQSEINQQIQTMFEQGVMEPSTSPIIPLLIILKKKIQMHLEKRNFKRYLSFLQHD